MLTSGGGPRRTLPRAQAASRVPRQDAWQGSDSREKRRRSRRLLQLEGHRLSRGDKGRAGMNVAVARCLALGRRAAAKAAGACGDGEGEGAYALPMRVSETPASLVATTRLDPSPKVARCQTASCPFTFAVQTASPATTVLAGEWWRTLTCGTERWADGDAIAARGRCQPSMPARTV